MKALHAFTKTLYPQLEVYLWNDPQWPVRREMFRALKEAGFQEKVFKQMRQRLENTNENLRIRAIRMLGASGMAQSDEVVKGILDGITLDTSTRVRIEALRAATVLELRHPALTRELQKLVIY